MKKVSIFGVSIDDCSLDDAQQRVEEYLSQDIPKMIVTPNPEILMKSRSDEGYREALHDADLAIPDGSGLRLVSAISHTVHGADLAQYILSRANAKAMKVVCLVREDGRSSIDDVMDAVKKLAPQVEVRGVGMKKDQINNAQIVKSISEFHPDVIFVGLGFPEQELWLHKHLRHILSAKIGMAVGGTFDFWSGVAVRAPRSIQRLHVEWLWRVIKEPKRLGRIIQATIVFPFFTLISRN